MMATAASALAAVSRTNSAWSRSSAERGRAHPTVVMLIRRCYTINTMPSARPTNTSAQLMPRTNSGLEDAGMFVRGIV
jgi:hypothetical protein